MAVVQELRDSDMANRSRVAKRLFGILSNDVIIFKTDETHSHLSGCQQTEFSLFCVEEDRQRLHQQPLRSECVTVWCEVANFVVMGLISWQTKMGVQLQSHLLVMLKC
jgi:hypothetical protein